MSRRQCKGTNRRGEPCGVAPSKGSDWCRAHDPNLPESDRFGSREQSARAGASEKPRVPRLREALAARIEERADEIIAALLDGISATEGFTIKVGPDETEFVEHPDFKTRLQYVREALDRHLGRPKQQTEITGPEGGAVQVEQVDLSRLSTDELRELRGLLGRAAPDA
jgi:hypothetical protein